MKSVSYFIDIISNWCYNAIEGKKIFGYVKIASDRTNFFTYKRVLF